MTPVRLEPAALRSQVKHSTTEPLHSPRFICGLLSLTCNEGRDYNAQFVERLCPLCKSDIESEFHFLFVCSNLSQIRLNYISIIWYTYPTVDKFIQLCTSTNKRTINNISGYIFVQ